MSLEGTKTRENLNEAFAGESQANRRSLWFAEKADVEGYPDTSALFRSVAEGETGHAHGHLEYLAQVGDPVTGEPIGAFNRASTPSPEPDFEVGRVALPCRSAFARPSDSPRPS